MNKMPRLFLGNLGHDCRQRDIEKIFRGYGDLKNINIKVGIKSCLIIEIHLLFNFAGSVRVYGD